MRRWREQGIEIMIYSSGSVAAQKLLFQYTTTTSPASDRDTPKAKATDLNPLISGYFDTVNAGPKAEAASYSRIAAQYPENGALEQWLFLSDNVKEVEAAKQAGMISFVVVREGNAPLSESEREENVLVQSFSEVGIKSAE